MHKKVYWIFVTAVRLIKVSTRWSEKFDDNYVHWFRYNTTKPATERN